jgi:hypothetical protein
MSRGAYKMGDNQFSDFLASIRARVLDVVELSLSRCGVLSENSSAAPTLGRRKLEASCGCDAIVVSSLGHGSTKHKHLVGWTNTLLSPRRE